MSKLSTITDGTLTAAVSSMGAQLMSLERDGTEYLWQGDPRWWSRRAPILFPTVGVLKDDHAESAAGEISLKRHGFARNEEFDIVEEASDHVELRLASSPATRASYPYDFELRLVYTVADGALEQRFVVTNTGTTELPFSLGAHPAFNVPCGAGKDVREGFEDYELRFSRPWTASSLSIDADGLYDLDNPVPLLNDADVLPLSHGLFRLLLTITLQDVPDSTVSLVGTKSGSGVEVRFEGFPYLGVWSADNEAPFVAVEPWCGLADPEDATGVFEDKPGIMIAAPGEVIERALTIRPL